MTTRPTVQQRWDSLQALWDRYYTLLRSGLQEELQARWDWILEREAALRSPRTPSTPGSEGESPESGEYVSRIARSPEDYETLIDAVNRHMKTIREKDQEIQQLETQVLQLREDWELSNQTAAQLQRRFEVEQTSGYQLERDLKNLQSELKSAQANNQQLEDENSQLKERLTKSEQDFKRYREERQAPPDTPERGGRRGRRGRR